MSKTPHATRTETRPLLLAGEPVETSECQAVVFPYDDSEVGSVWLADDEVIERALDGAARAEEEIAALPPYRRAEILTRAARLVGERANELAEQMTLETGLAIRESRLEVSERSRSSRSPPRRRDGSPRWASWFRSTACHAERAASA